MRRGRTSPCVRTVHRFVRPPLAAVALDVMHQLLHLVLTHGDARQVAALATTLAKATLRYAQVAMGEGREEGGAAAVPGAAMDTAGAKAQVPGSNYKISTAALSSVAYDAFKWLLRICEADKGVTRCAKAARSGSGGGGHSARGTWHAARGGEPPGPSPCNQEEGRQRVAGRVCAGGDGGGGVGSEGGGDGGSGRAPLHGAAEGGGAAGAGKGSEAAGAQGGGSCALSAAGPGGCGDEALALASLALCRWLPLCAHIADMCQRQQQEQQEGEKQGLGQGENQQSAAEDPAGPLPAALRAGIALVLRACTAAHEAGDARALGSWRQLLYDMGSYMWVRDGVDQELFEPPWWDRGWSPGLAVSSRAQEQQQREQQARGAEAEKPGIGRAQRGGDPATDGSEYARRRSGSASDLQQQGADQEQAGMEQQEQEQQGKEQQQERQDKLRAQAQEQQEEGQQGLKQQERRCTGTWMQVNDQKLPYHLLPPPCDAGLLLPTCCYPLCTSLAGDCEAGMELRAWGGWGEGGGKDSDGSLYCSRECRTAHTRFRREQEVKELGWRVRRWGRGQ